MAVATQVAAPAILIGAFFKVDGWRTLLTLNFVLGMPFVTFSWFIYSLLRCVFRPMIAEDKQGLKARLAARDNRGPMAWLPVAFALLILSTIFVWLASWIGSWYHALGQCILCWFLTVGLLLRQRQTTKGGVNQQRDMLPDPPTEACSHQWDLERSLESVSSSGMSWGSRLFPGRV